VQTVTGTGPIGAQRDGSTVSLSLGNQINGQSLVTSGGDKLRNLWFGSGIVNSIETGDQLTLDVSPTIAGLDGRVTTLEGDAIQSLTFNSPINVTGSGTSRNIGVIAQVGEHSPLTTIGALRGLWSTSDIALTVEPGDQLTIGVSPTIAGLDARTTTLETNTASLSQSGASVVLNTTGNVNFQEAGTSWMFYAQPNSALVFSPPIAIQSRGRHDFYDATEPLSLMARFAACGPRATSP
jgi:hypothetical protein